MNSWQAIFDCNNFYVSCERVFQPKWRNTPVVVLSNNDGCIIARSDEAKALGIEMGAPLFKVRDFCRQQNVIIRSSNYALYGDISQRVMQTIERFEPNLLIYSIDEAFAQLTGVSHINLRQYLNTIIHRIRQEIGMPISIGLAPTKTLAKIALFIAKKKMREPLCILDDDIPTLDALANCPVAEIWGVGRRWAQALQAQGIANAYSLAELSASHVQSLFNINLARTVRELRGFSCISLDGLHVKKKNILSSRSFGKPQTDLQQIEQALVHHCMVATKKLRAQGSTTNAAQIFIKTSRHHSRQRYYSKTASIQLPAYTQDPSVLSSYAKYALREIFKPGLEYQKLGIYLLNLIDIDSEPLNQDDFFQQQSSCITSTNKLMVMDAINQRYGNNSLMIASQVGSNKCTWQMQQNHKSPSYTTCWSDILKVT